MKADNTIIDTALREDNAGKDITTRLLIPKDQTSVAYIISKEKAVVAGTEIAGQILKKIDPRLRVKIYRADGKKVNAGTKILEIRGKTRSILTGERVALNFLTHLSGVATMTAAFVQETKGTKAKIFDTRKTLPGLRKLEKYAVRCGGGLNHRLDLKAMAMIKDNHLSALKNTPLAEAVRKAKKGGKPVELEIASMTQFRQACKARPDIILLDNMKPSCVKSAVTYLKRRPSGKKILLEASGGISLKNIRSFARTGVDRISIGALTHSAPAVNMSLEIK